MPCLPMRSSLVRIRHHLRLACAAALIAAPFAPVGRADTDVPMQGLINLFYYPVYDEDDNIIGYAYGGAGATGLAANNGNPVLIPISAAALGLPYRDWSSSSTWLPSVLTGTPGGIAAQIYFVGEGPGGSVGVSLASTNAVIAGGPTAQSFTWANAISVPSHSVQFSVTTHEAFAVTIPAGAYVRANVSPVLASLTNQGQIDLPAGRTLQTNTLFEHLAGSLGGQGTLRITGGTALLAGPQDWGTGAQVLVSNAQLTLASDAGSTAARPLSIQASNATITINSPQHLAQLALTNSSATVAPGANPLVLDSLQLGAGSSLTLANSPLVVYHAGPSPAASLRAAIASGALKSSLAASLGLPVTIGLVDNQRIGQLSWRGVDLTDGSDFSQVLLASAYVGDVNLDGLVDELDYANVVGNMGLTGASWFDGDINHDGVVTLADFELVKQHLGLGSGGALGEPLAMIPWSAQLATSLVAVPEPGTLSLSLLAASLLLRRRCGRG
jgi:hypothetical protein